MKLSIRLRNSLVFVFLMVSMMMPAKMGMGQGFHEWKTFGAGYSGPWYFSGPSSVVVDKQQNVLIADTLNNRIVWFDKLGNAIKLLYGFNLPNGLFVDTDDSILVADQGNNVFKKISPNGDVSTFGEPGSGVGQFLQPIGITKDASGTIWTIEWSPSRVQRKTLGGNWEVVFEQGSGDNQVFQPQGISADKSGNVWISDTFNSRIIRIDSTGKVTYVGSRGTGPGEFNLPCNAAVDIVGRLWVCDTNNDRIQVRNLDGTWNSSYVGFPTAQHPEGLSCADNGQIVFGNWGDGKVFAFVPIYPDYFSPLTTISGISLEAWTNDGLLQFEGVDNLWGSGVKEIHYSINMGAEQIVSASTATFALTETGSHSISYFAVDNAGNTETAKLATVKIDKIAPVTTLTRNAGLISLSATDAHSGVAKIKFQINGGAVVDYSAPFADTIHKVTYSAEDVATNFEAAKTDIINAGVQSISVTQPRLNGGTAVIGTVTLDKAAGVGGTVINLASSLPGVAVVDATVTVPEGATTVSFDIDANPVAIDTSVSITASIYETSQSALVTVQAPMPSSLTWSVSPVVGGTSTTGTLTLTSPAPTGGTTVSLASSSLSALVGSTVTIPAGAMTTTFNVSTNVVSNDTSAVISATVYGVKLKSTLSILGPKVSSVTLAAASIASTMTTTGTVTLSTNAPVGGKVVNLSSSNAAVASVPVSVTVAAGARTATFTVTAGSVLANTNATITASTNGSTGTANITVTPPAAAISTITTNVPAATGGVAVTGTVTLTRAAPTGGAVVTLTSSSTTIGTVPASVTVPAGATSATFTITTRTVTAATTLTVTGTYLGVAKTATITVNPVRVVSTLTLNPTSVRGGTNSTGTVTLSGVATEAVVVTLSSGTTTVARVPASVTVPAGSTTATFTITTLAQTATRTSVITAATGTTSRTATLTVTR